MRIIWLWVRKLLCRLSNSPAFTEDWLNLETDSKSDDNSQCVYYELISH